jgi:glutathione S-transferase
MVITLYYTHRTRALRPRWVLEELELPYRLQLIDLFGGEGQTAAYRRIHPHGSVPAIDIDGHVMIESCAICHWLSDRYAEKQLAPPASEAAARMDYEQWIFYVPGTLEPLAFQILLHSVILPETQRVPDMLPWATRRYQSLLKFLNKALAERDYIAGDRFSTADILLGSTLLWLPEMLDNQPALSDYTARLQQRAAYQRAATDPAPRA